MPTYQYVCTDCAEPLEVVQKFSDDALTECPACGGRLRKVFSAAGIIFKGSGFYRTDSRGKPAAASASSPSNGSSDSSSSSSSESSGTKTESSAGKSESSSSTKPGSSGGSNGSGAGTSAKTGSGPSEKVA